MKSACILFFLKMFFPLKIAPHGVTWFLVWQSSGLKENLMTLVTEACGSFLLLIKMNYLWKTESMRMQPLTFINTLMETNQLIQNT